MKYRPAIGSTSRARELRSNATDAERALWRLLRESFPEARFRRQVPIRSFFADFASHRAKLVIEVDGGQHSPEVDHERTKLIEAEGYRLIRFWNHDVLGNPDGVWRKIADSLSGKAPPLDGSAAAKAASGGSSQAADGLGRGGLSDPPSASGESTPTMGRLASSLGRSLSGGSSSPIKGEG